MRVNRSPQRKERKKKVLKLAKGFYGRTKNCYQAAVDRVNKKLQYQYRDRRNLKRDMRRLWILRINNALATLDIKYSRFIHKLNQSDVSLNRKSLSELALNNKIAFDQIVNQVMN